MYIEPKAQTQYNETVVTISLWDHIFIWIGLPLLGAVLGWLFRCVAAWGASLSWIPYQNLFNLVASFPEPQGSSGMILMGVCVGLVLAYLAAIESLKITIADDYITIERGETSRVVNRTSVDAVFVDKKHLILLDPTTAELARERSDLPVNQLREALLTHGYPWSANGDPYENAYWLWVEDTPNLPAVANTLFKARARALAQGDDDAVTLLRMELAKLGTVVRDEKKHQYWRCTERQHDV
ncbi:MAG: hypothetical protein GFH27_549287n148 [Chloroflexi bacterium AL-W]|nr:hypothetical protein [Chloroflexi bacterium AL-N1]NOK66422.1 hypothetical protein [Chloroflexi bacterium AL-N10]NOK71810.1 hypothetical protein [Chloroflexi bacterium AL-N5]NOK81067.1 hypothetical protein [Chloroflexi bacterium AL-W]NOK89340.1 hypothetical protein [Chloroflexi bacterium AL-N15]